MRIAALAILLSAVLSAAEYAVLSNGFRIRADRHEVVEGKVKLFMADGNLEFPATDIVTFEQEEYVAPPAPAAAPDLAVQPIADPLALVHQAAERHGLPKEFVESVARAESGLNVAAVSPKGAIGLMQLMPGTAADLNADPHDPAQNADAGVRYLRELLLKYQHDPQQVRLALAAYNAGPGAVDRHKGVPPFRETLAYIERVIRQHTKLKQ